MIDVRQNIPTEPGQLRLTAIECTQSHCMYNNHGLCACVLPAIYQRTPAHREMYGHLENPILECESYAPIKIEVRLDEKLKEEIKEESIPSNGREGVFFNYDKKEPFARHCKVIHCVHCTKPYRTCDIVPNLKRSKLVSGRGTCYSFESNKGKLKEEV